MMKPLFLNPLPAHRADDESVLLRMEREGFVDEAVVTALVRDSHPGRSIAYPDDLALAADDLDFAGWRLSKTVTARSPEVPPHVIDAIVRRASPQVARTPERDSPHPMSRRWLAGLATLLFSAVVLALVARPETPFQTLLSPGKSAAAKPVSPHQTEPVKDSPGQTESSFGGR